MITGFCSGIFSLQFMQVTIVCLLVIEREKFSFKTFFRRRKSFLKRISKQSMDRHIAFMPYQHLWYGFHDVLTKRQYEKNWEIIDRGQNILLKKEDIKPH